MVRSHADVATDGEAVSACYLKVLDGRAGALSACPQALPVDFESVLSQCLGLLGCQRVKAGIYALNPYHTTLAGLGISIVR